MSTTTDTDVINQYLLDINVPRDINIPLEVYIAFPKTLNDHTVREQVKNQWLNGNDKQYVAMQLMFSKEITCIFRPTGVLIDWTNILISVYTPSGLSVLIPPLFLKELGGTIENQIENLNDYLFVTIEKRQDALIAKTVIPLRGKIETEIATEILDKTNYTPLEVLIIGLGYKPTDQIKRLFIPRLVTWFKGFDGKPMHVAQFTLPETAKTHFGIRNETLFNWRYLPEPPTLARLVLDARQGVLGEVFLRNGIIFDEFDKWNLDNADRRYTFDAILTGMEQGKWVRAVSALGVRPPDVTRLLPILFFGNLGDFAKLYGVVQFCTRAWFTEIFSRRLTHDVSALADRLTIIDSCFIRIPVMDFLTYKVLPDSIIRGIVHELQQQVKKQEVSQLKGRLRRHSDNLYAILNTFMKVTAEQCDSIVAGTFEWDKQLPHEITVQPTPPPRDITTPQTQIIPPPSYTFEQMLKITLDLIEKLQKETGIVETAYLRQQLEKQYDIKGQTIHAILKQLLTEGTIYEPREGYIKKV